MFLASWRLFHSPPIAPASWLLQKSGNSWNPNTFFCDLIWDLQLQNGVRTKIVTRSSREKRTTTDGGVQTASITTFITCMAQEKSSGNFISDWRLELVRTSEPNTGTSNDCLWCWAKNMLTVTVMGEQVMPLKLMKRKLPNRPTAHSLCVTAILRVLHVSGLWGKVARLKHYLILNPESSTITTQSTKPSEQQNGFRRRRSTSRNGPVRA